MKKIPSTPVAAVAPFGAKPGISAADADTITPATAGSAAKVPFQVSVVTSLNSAELALSGFFSLLCP
ncbi:MAG: hypothetical protein LBQ57_04775 [Spirochaetales bacterium]|jgi:hypothetical protein|nr:hypothetical protein [Spirochaetales bacterium]